MLCLSGLCLAPKGPPFLPAAEPSFLPFLLQALEQERLQNFQQLCQLEDEALVPNQQEMECRICYLKVEPGNGVLLRECLHSFCRWEASPGGRGGRRQGWASPPAAL